MNYPPFKKYEKIGINQSTLKKKNHWLKPSLSLSLSFFFFLAQIHFESWMAGASSHSASTLRGSLKVANDAAFRKNIKFIS